jgi:hypothetical protein
MKWMRAWKNIRSRTCGWFLGRQDRSCWENFRWLSTGAGPLEEFRRNGRGPKWW